MKITIENFFFVLLVVWWNKKKITAKSIDSTCSIFNISITIEKQKDNFFNTFLAPISMKLLKIYDMEFDDKIGMVLGSEYRRRFHRFEIFTKLIEMEYGQRSMRKVWPRKKPAAVTFCKSAHMGYDWPSVPRETIKRKDYKTCNLQE